MCDCWTCDGMMRGIDIMDEEEEDDDYADDDSAGLAAEGGDGTKGMTRLRPWTSSRRRRRRRRPPRRTIDLAGSGGGGPLAASVVTLVVVVAVALAAASVAAAAAAASGRTPIGTLWARAGARKGPRTTSKRVVSAFSPHVFHHGARGPPPSSPSRSSWLLPPPPPSSSSSYPSRSVVATTCFRNLLRSLSLSLPLPLSRMDASRRGGGGAMSRKKEAAAAKRNKKNRKEITSETRDEDKEKEGSTNKFDSKSIYSLPALYDLAFGYRNYDQEVNFLLSMHHKHKKGTNVGRTRDGHVGVRILELAAGPARHALTAVSLYSQIDAVADAVMAGTAATETGTETETETMPALVSGATAIDLSVDMVRYGTENADAILGSSGPMRDLFLYLHDDVRSFPSTTNDNCNAGASTGAGTHDAAWMLLGSMQHLTTNDDAIRFLHCTNRALRPGGTLIIELPHPRETFAMTECTRNGWEVPLEYGTDENYHNYDDDGGGDNESASSECGTLKVVWGDVGDVFDPITQVRNFTVAMELVGGNGGGENNVATELGGGVREVVPMRLYTAQEIDALGRVAGMELVGMYGALGYDDDDDNYDDDDDDDDDNDEWTRENTGGKEVSIYNEDGAFRLVCVLRKKKNTDNDE